MEGCAQVRTLKFSIFDFGFWIVSNQIGVFILHGKAYQE
jgi:hypothetical protein